MAAQYRFEDNGPPRRPVHGAFSYVLTEGQQLGSLGVLAKAELR
jgi:hypothetical protein